MAFIQAAHAGRDKSVFGQVHISLNTDYSGRSGDLIGGQETGSMCSAQLAPHATPLTHPCPAHPGRMCTVAPVHQITLVLLFTPSTNCKLTTTDESTSFTWPADQHYQHNRCVAYVSA
ncbi:hypothetical protein J6590_046519 [Homalodisca vitripennis]|nr:hypothetical protein J6590_046519 [Homalodisca vitripennis]